MRLTCCMIVRDEEVFLERALLSIRPFVDELVIVDTGSVDSTPEIAKKFADIYDEIKWENFSHARNHSLSLATGDYILILDADEWIEKGMKDLRKHLEEEKPNCLIFSIFSGLPENQIISSNITPQIRVWKNLDSIRYKGRVHNQISLAIQEAFGEDISSFPITILHEGYSLSQELKVKKYQRRIELHYKELEEENDPRWVEYYKYQLASAYFMCMDYDNALFWFKQVNHTHLTEDNQYRATLLMVNCCLVIAWFEEANIYAARLMDIWPHEPTSHFWKGITLTELRKYAPAFFFLAAAIRLFEEGENFRYAVDKFKIAGVAGEVAFSLEKYTEARSLLRLHLQKYPDNKQVQRLESQIPESNNAPTLSLVGTG